MSVRLLQKKKLELQKIKKVLAQHNFFSIVSVFDECSAEFFTFKDDLNALNFKTVKFKKRFYNSLLGEQMKQMQLKPCGAIILIYSDTPYFKEFTRYFALLGTCKDKIMHIYSYNDFFICDLERLQAICFNDKKNSVTKINYSVQCNLLFFNLVLRCTFFLFYHLISHVFLYRRI